MKKWVVTIFSLVIIFGSGSLAFADSNTNYDEMLNFGQMKPHIEKMHPDLSTREQKQMLDTCHGKDGMMQKSGNEHHRNMMDSQDG